MLPDNTSFARLWSALQQECTQPRPNARRLDEILEKEQGWGLPPGVDPQAGETARIYAQALKQWKGMWQQEWRRGKSPMESVKEFESVLSAGLVIETQALVPNLTGEMGTVVRGITSPQVMDAFIKSVVRVADRFTHPQGQAAARERAMAILLHMWETGKDVPGIAALVETAVLQQESRLLPGRVEWVVGQEMALGYLPFSSRLAGWLVQYQNRQNARMETQLQSLSGTQKGGEGVPAQLHPVEWSAIEGQQQIKALLRWHLMNHPRRLTVEHFALARALEQTGGDNSLKESICLALSSDALPAQVKRKVWGTMASHLSEVQRSLILERQLERLYGPIPHLPEYWGKNLQDEMQVVAVMAQAMSPVELIKNLQRFLPEMKATLDAEVWRPMMARLHETLGGVPDYAEPPSRTLVREWWAQLPEKAKVMEGGETYEQPPPETAINWNFLEDCLRRSFNPVPLPDGQTGQTGDEPDVLRHFPRTHPDGNVHVGNVAEFLIRRAGAGDVTALEQVYRVLPLVPGKELAGRLEKPQVQEMVVNCSELQTVVAFEIRERWSRARHPSEMTTWQNVGKTLVRNPDWDITPSMVACQPGRETHSMEAPRPFRFSGMER